MVPVPGRSDLERGAPANRPLNCPADPSRHENGRQWCGSHALARTSTRTAPAWTLTDLVRAVAGSAAKDGTTVVLLSIPSDIAESEAAQRVAEAPGAAISGIGQHDRARQAGGNGVADLIERHLNPGAEREVGWHRGMQTAFAVVRPVLGQVEIAGDRHADGLGRQRQADQRLAVGRRADQTPNTGWRPTECRPLLSKVVSSTIQCSVVPHFCIAGTTRPSTRSRTGPSPTSPQRSHANASDCQCH